MDIIKNLSKEHKNHVLEFINQEIERRKLKWCCDNEQFIQGLLLGLEVGIVEINKYNKDESNSEEQLDD